MHSNHIQEIGRANEREYFAAAVETLTEGEKTEWFSPRGIFLFSIVCSAGLAASVRVVDL